MIKVNSSITIKADIQKIWHFLGDFSLGLSCNRFHGNINIEKSYSIDCEQNVVIKHNFGFGDVDMKLNIEESIPPNKLVINEQKINQELNGFNHTSTFEIIENSNFCDLHYTVIGTFGNKVADLSFSPILKAVTIEELSKIKKLIESSEDNINTFKNKQYNPI